MVLSKIKTNIQKRETKDQPQTNGSYKIRQTTIKIMGYTHIHMHPWAKWKQSNNKKKYSTHGMWDLSSPTRDRTCPLHWEWRVLTTRSLGKPQHCYFCSLFDSLFPPSLVYFGIKLNTDFKSGVWENVFNQSRLILRGSVLFSAELFKPNSWHQPSTFHESATLSDLIYGHSHSVTRCHIFLISLTRKLRPTETK